MNFIFANSLKTKEAVADEDSDLMNMLLSFSYSLIFLKFSENRLNCFQLLTCNWCSLNKRLL